MLMQERKAAERALVRYIGDMRNHIITVEGDANHQTFSADTLAIFKEEERLAMAALRTLRENKE